MTLSVTDVRSGADRQIDEAAKAIGQSSQRRAIFREIHSGKKRIKTVQEIADATALPRKRVLEEAVKLAHKQIITKTKRDGDTAYQRDNFYYVNLREIFRRADSSSRTARPKAIDPPTQEFRLPRRKQVTTARRGSLKKDIFLSHASEDKTAIARPLFRALTRAGISVWYRRRTRPLQVRSGGAQSQLLCEGLAAARIRWACRPRECVSREGDTANLAPTD
jgi:hypothetical protein